MSCGGRMRGIYESTRKSEELACSDCPPTTCDTPREDSSTGCGRCKAISSHVNLRSFASDLQCKDQATQARLATSSYFGAHSFPRMATPPSNPCSVSDASWSGHRWIQSMELCMLSSPQSSCLHPLGTLSGPGVSQSRPQPATWQHKFR